MFPTDFQLNRLNLSHVFGVWSERPASAVYRPAGSVGRVRQLRTSERREPAFPEAFSECFLEFMGNVNFRGLLSRPLIT